MLPPINYKLKYFPPKMDEEAFKARLADLKRDVAKIDRRIENFDVDDVTLADKDRYLDYLDENRRIVEACQEAAYNLIE